MPNFNLENYVPVNERLAQFHKDNPEARVVTTVIEHDREFGFVMIRAEIYRTSDATIPSATGHAFEERAAGYVNKTSYVENAETSAVGRALALLGYQIEKGIASREEMEKVERYEKSELTAVPNANTHVAAGLTDLATAKQVGMIRSIAKEAGVDPEAEAMDMLNCSLGDLSKKAASNFIDHLLKLSKHAGKARSRQAAV